MYQFSKTGKQISTWDPK